MPKPSKFLPIPIAHRIVRAPADVGSSVIVSALADAIARQTPAAPGSTSFPTPIPGLILLRADCPMPPMPRLYKPALCLVAQGAKGGTFGDVTLDYRAGQASVVGVERPGVGRVTEASADVPFLGAVYEFDRVMMREVLDGLDEPLAPLRQGAYGVFVTDIDARVAACVVRLIELLATPRAIPVLAPAIARELVYWLLTGPSGGDIVSVVFGVDRSERMIAAIHELRERFAETVRVGELARTARMSPAAFHRSFKSITSMTPLQFQKQLRLLEARTLMLADAANAETAAYRVGYESPSQFSREYARMFGAPPRRDVARRSERLRSAAVVATAGDGS